MSSFALHALGTRTFSPQDSAKSEFCETQPIGPAVLVELAFTTPDKARIDGDEEVSSRGRSFPQCGMDFAVLFAALARHCTLSVLHGTWN